MKLNNKGFTMVELLVAMAIMGLLVIMAFPTIRAIQTNNTEKKFKSFGQSMLSGARLYVDSYGEDLFDASLTNETVDINVSDMVKKQIVDTTVINESDCSESKVFVVKYGDDYTYCLYLMCKSGNTEVFKLDDFDKKTQCKKFETVSIEYIYKDLKRVDVKTKGVENYVVLPPNTLFSSVDSSFNKWLYGTNTYYNPGDKIGGKINNNISLKATFASAPTPDPDPDPDPTPTPPTPTPPPTPDPSGKPTCNISADIGTNKNGWFNKDVTLTLNIGGDATSYGLDTNKSSTNKTKSKKVTTEGTTKYYGYVANSKGSSECEFEVKLDKTPPSISVSTKNDKYNITADLSDNVSGLASYKWKSGDSTSISGKSKTVKASVGTKDGSYSIKATDKAGNSVTKDINAYKWCTKETKEEFGFYRWGDITKSCSGNSYYRKYRFHEYTCSCKVDAKDTSHVCSKDAKLGNHGSDYAYIYYKHNDNGKDACNGTKKINSYVDHVCNSNEYAATNKPTFDYHGYKFFDGKTSDGWNNFEGKGYTYWRKAGLISNSLSPDEACAEACRRRN